MLIPIITVSFLVHIYSCSYMSHDPHQQRFFSYLSMFTFAMIILVTGLSALLVNRFGDAFLVLGLSFLLMTTGSLDYNTIFALGNFINTDLLIIILLCFLIAATAKSGLSTLISGLIAVVSNDIKRIIALSTMSQVGFMMIAIGVSAYNLALFHLICHSFFKALLFMSAGSVIHSIASEYQDLRVFGSFKQYLPLTYTCMLIASLSLMAIPSLTGYYSKDIIIESMYGNYEFSGYIVYLFALSSATLTSLYSLRLIYYTFIHTPNNSKYIYYYLFENDIILIIPMIILTILSIFIGYILRDVYLGMGSSFYNLFIHPNNLNLIDTEFSLNSILKILPLITSIGGGLIMLYIYEFNYKLFYVFNNKLLRSLYIFFNQKIMYDQIFNNIILRFSLYISLLTFLGPLGLSQFIKFFNLKLNKLVYLNFGLIIELIILS
ncbi:hypothetical protein PACTADRAFT_77894 [Pachysolen tannophilus NRRL Y-2460]|uniref:NADH:ubiquinone reductase (H(+)-translocating) n=1 Tax=Pachysolen tannophilus NRRL Y-2460 TaxID=669874 RepID=A0A1E4TMW7_PACTA|nr:hypothetical protein PACTADRAFT_77894 [Pachysolen tannophilus NRRL Y-2460]